MLIHPQFDPVAISIGPLAIRWYGLMYIIAFAQFWALGRWRMRTLSFLRDEQQWKPAELDDLLFYGALGVILGARLGEVLFYQPAYYLSHPFEILALWHGGMSFHGGFLGVLAGMTYYQYKTQRPWLEITDFIAPLVPLGLGAGRLGNFINGELWGRFADPSIAWAMVFPRVDHLPRHPSQIYEALLEGLALFIILWFFSGKKRPRGAVSGVFLIGYGSFRFICEYFRTPDAGIFGQSDIISMGQWLSLPMVCAGLWLFYRSYRH